MAEKILFRVKIRNPRRIRTTIARAVRRQRGTMWNEIGGGRLGKRGLRKRSRQISQTSRPGTEMQEGVLVGDLGLDIH